MKYFRYAVNGPEVHLYPLVCWHIGAKQSSEKFIKEVIRQIKDDPLARWLYLGDAGECVIKTSKGNIYEQLMTPGDQLRVAAELMIPIKAKGIGGIRGNHGNRIDKDSGLGWDETLCARIGIPYFGVSALGTIDLKITTTAHMTPSVYCHHGNSGAITAAGKMSAGHRAEQFIAADVILTSHTHACGFCFPPKQYAYTDARTRSIKWGLCRSYVCGSAYDSRSGYAEEKQYPPLLPEHIVVTLKSKRRHNAAQDTCVLDVSHRTIEGFAEEYVGTENYGKWRLGRKLA